MPVAEEVASTATSKPRPFGEIICERRGWPREAFVERAFWRCLPAWSLPVAAVIYAIRRKTFAPDFEVLKDVAQATSVAEINTAANSLRHDPRVKRSFIRHDLGIRVSGKRLTILVKRARGG
jgi:hypothetical protein